MSSQNSNSSSDPKKSKQKQFQNSSKSDSDSSQKSTRDQKNSKPTEFKNSSKSDSDSNQKSTRDRKNSKPTESKNSSKSDSDSSQKSAPDPENSKKKESENFGDIRKFSDNVRSESKIKVNIDIVLSELMTIQFDVVMAPLVLFWSKQEVSLFKDAIHRQFCSRKIITTNELIRVSKQIVCKIEKDQRYAAMSRRTSGAELTNLSKNNYQLESTASDTDQPFGDIRYFSGYLRTHSGILVNIDIVLSELMTIEFDAVMAPLIRFWSKREVNLFLNDLHLEFHRHNVITTDQLIRVSKQIVCKIEKDRRISAMSKRN
jgi:hypothetical protein